MTEKCNLTDCRRKVLFKGLLLNAALFFGLICIILDIADRIDQVETVHFTLLYTCLLDLENFFL